MLPRQQVVGLPGGIVLGQSSSQQPAVKMKRGCRCTACVVLHSPAAGTIEFCWVDELAPRKSVHLELHPATNNKELMETLGRQIEYPSRLP
ncbi:MAG: hypothetical protein R3C56_25120 [Pirellulaceae bacterium]